VPLCLGGGFCLRFAVRGFTSQNYLRKKSNRISDSDDFGLGFQKPPAGAGKSHECIIKIMQSGEGSGSFNAVNFPVNPKRRSG
jgi:hypothetical protein